VPITLTIPMIPPSVNHYVKHTRSGRHYKTKAAGAFENAVLIFSSHIRETIEAGAVEATIYLGKGDKGDVDNFGKVILDSLAATKIIRSDATVTDLILRKRRDRKNPRTEITVTAL
jgi:crossover junction endodeoxyribonuclease RusA